MHQVSPPPKCLKERIDFYSDQTEELLQTSKELFLAYELLREYSSVDAEYYYGMYTWLNHRFDYVLPNALTFIPRTI
jgi:hypothetical protein